MSVSAFPYGVFGGPIVVTVSGESLSHVVGNGNDATAGIRVMRDGTLEKVEGVVETQIDAATDWIIPNSKGFTGYHVKFSKGALDPAAAGGDAIDTWHAIDTTVRTIWWTEFSDDSTQSATLTVAISDDGGTTTLDSGTFPITLTVGLPP